MAIGGKLLRRLQLCFKNAATQAEMSKKKEKKVFLAVYRGEFSFFFLLFAFMVRGVRKERSTLLVVCQLCLLWFHA